MILYKSHMYLSFSGTTHPSFFPGTRKGDYSTRHIDLFFFLFMSSPPLPSSSANYITSISLLIFALAVVMMVWSDMVKENKNGFDDCIHQ